MDQSSKQEVESVDEANMNRSRMPVWRHLEELRTVLVRTLIAISFGFCLTYYFSEQVMRFLEAPILNSLPVGSQHLYFSGLTDKFMTYLKVSLYASLALTSPYILMQVWKFVAPGLKENERKWIAPFLGMGTVAFVAGLAFGYYVVLPGGYHFLVNFGGPNEKPLINIADYFGLTLQLLFCMGILFELPVVLMLLGKLGVIKREWLIQFRPHAYVGLAVAAAILTPTPDAFTMLLVLVPLLLLYEFSVQMIRWVMKP
jgi:sec-independent protein translocase protein TatC